MASDRATTRSSRAAFAHPYTEIETESTGEGNERPIYLQYEAKNAWGGGVAHVQ